LKNQSQRKKKHKIYVALKVNQAEKSEEETPHKKFAKDFLKTIFDEENERLI